MLDNLQSLRLIYSHNTQNLRVTSLFGESMPNHAWVKVLCSRGTITDSKTITQIVNRIAANPTFRGFIYDCVVEVTDGAETFSVPISLNNLQIRLIISNAYNQDNSGKQPLIKYFRQWFNIAEKLASVNNELDNVIDVDEGVVLSYIQNLHSRAPRIIRSYLGLVAIESALNQLFIQRGELGTAQIPQNYTDALPNTQLKSSVTGETGEGKGGAGGGGMKNPADDIKYAKIKEKQNPLSTKLKAL